MRRILTILLLLLTVKLYAQPTPLRAGYQDSAYSYSSGWSTSPIGYVYLPWNYNNNTNRYPVIIFFSGLGQYGGGVTNELTDGLPQDINSGIVPYAVSGTDTTWFIVISGHAPDQYHVDANIQSLYSACLSATAYGLRIDTNRIYTTGLSEGGEIAYSANQVNWADGYKAAAILSMSPAHGMTTTYYTASNYINTPIWCLGGNNDLVVGSSAQTTYNFLVANNGQKSYRLTIYNGGHSGWTTFYNPTWTDYNTDTISNSPAPPTGKNIYQWLSQFALINPPTVNAGSNQVLSASTKSTTLTGSATTTNGSIKSYLWSQVSGNTVTITSPTSATTTVTGLNMGNTYVFKLTATDDSSQTASSTVSVTVNDSAITTGQSIYINFSSDASHNGGGYWNDLNTIPTATTVINNLKDSTNKILSVGLVSVNGNISYDNGGKSTGNNSGIYPDNVITSDWYANPDGAIYTMKIKGLRADSLYNFTFFASNITSNRTSEFIIGVDTVTLLATNNTTAVVKIDSAKAASDSTINVSLTRGSGSHYGNINAMVIHGSFPYSNTPLSVNAGADQFLDTGAKSTFFKGSGSVGNGKTITGYQWSQISGSPTTIVSPSTDTTTVTGLSKGNNYSFQLKVTDDSSETATDTVNVFINAADTTDYKLTLDSAGKYWNGDTLYYEFSSTNRYINAQNLIGNQTYDTTSTPSQGYFYSNDTTNRGIIDLGGMYAIKSAYMWGQAVITTMMIQIGSPGNWSAPIALNVNGTGWYRFPLNGYLYTRYIRVWDNVGYGAGNLLLYGHLVKDSLSRIQPAFPYHKPSTTMRDAVGTNVTWIPNQMYTLFGSYRYYAGNGSAVDTSVHNVDSLQYNFGSVSSGYLHYYFPSMSTPLQNSVTPPNEPYNLVKMVEDTGATFWYASNAWSGYYGNHGVNFPVDPVAHPDRDSSNPQDYDRISNYYWLQGVVYGNTTIPRSSVAYQVLRPDSVNYKTMTYVEPGNEYDEDWNNLGMIPSEWTAYMSAVYDGNGNTMGTRTGIKNASPTTVVIQPGSARNMATPKYIQYSQNIYAEAQRMRPKSAQTLPFDVANFHYYSNNDTIGIAPEGDSLRMKVERYYDMINQQSHGTMPIWCTEFGYDWNGVGKQTTPSHIGTMDSLILQGVWTIRAMLVMSEYVDRFIQYQMLDVNPLGGTYSTSGLMTDNGDSVYDNIYLPHPSLYYMMTFRHVLANYVFDSIARGGAGDSVWIYKYKNVNNDSVAYVVWCPTSTDHHITNMSFQTGHGSTQANIVNFAPIAEMLADTMTVSEQYGVSTPQQSTSSGTVNFNISEVPTFVLTTDSPIGGTLATNTVAPTNLIFRYPIYQSGYVILIYQDQNGKYYAIKLKNQ